MTPLELVLSKVKHKKSNNGYMANCPAHDDQNPSLGIKEDSDGKVILNCLAGCVKENVVAAIGLTMSDLFPKSQKQENRKSTNPNNKKNTLLSFAEEKCLPIEFLQKCGVREVKQGLAFLYLNEKSKPARTKIRTGTAHDGYWDSTYSDREIVPYGLPISLNLARQNGVGHLVEGESDTLTGILYKMGILGIPGARMTGKLSSSYIEGLNTLYLHQEPDEAGATFIADLKKKLKSFQYEGKVFVIQYPGNGLKDLNDLHCYCSKNNIDFKIEFQKLIDNATLLNLEETKLPPENNNISHFPSMQNTQGSINNQNCLIEANQWVYASDRGNYGQVTSVNPPNRTAHVFFKNLGTGHNGNATLSIDLLTPVHEKNVPQQFLDKAKPFKLITAKELLEQPPPEWLIENICLEKSVTFLYGQSGVGKSFIGLDISLSISTGIKWQNREVKSGAVIYVAAEGSSGIGKRLKAWLTYQKQESLPDNLYFITVPANLMHEQVTDSLIISIKEVCPTPKMIVLDTFARSLVGGDENSAKDTGLFIAGVDRLKEETGATILVLHHTQKSNSAVERGSSAIRGSADTMIMVQQESEHGRTTFSLKCDKQKDAEPFETLQFSLVPVLDSCVPVLTTFDQKVERTSDNIRLALEVLSTFVSTEGTTAGKWQTALKDKKISRSVFYRTLKVLVDEVAEEQPRYVKCINKRYFLTDEGKTFLGLKNQTGSSTSPISPNLVPETSETGTRKNKTNAEH